MMLVDYCRMSGEDFYSLECNLDMLRFIKAALRETLQDKVTIFLDHCDSDGVLDDINTLCASIKIVNECLKEKKE